MRISFLRVFRNKSGGRKVRKENSCSVVNCQKALKKGEFVKIGGKIYCLECAVLISKSEVGRLMRGVSFERD